MSFNPAAHMMRIRGNEYLPVAWRLVWFREEHPDWSIVTTPLKINIEQQYAVFSAQVLNEQGRVIATGTKMENVAGFAEWLEKAESGAVGRALAFCGYGTQFTPDLEEPVKADGYPRSEILAPSRPTRPPVPTR